MLKTGVVIALTLFVAAPQAADQASQPDLKRRRDQVQMLEGVLTNAVRLGAQNLSRRMQSADPSLLMTTGTARARGFILDGYGVFFDVDIPMLRSSVVWAFKTMNQDLQVGDALESLRAWVKSVRDPDSRANLEQALKRVELQVGPVQPPRPTAPAQQHLPPGVVSGAATVDADPGEPAMLDDPNAAYTEYVKAALIDAMLDFSGPLDLGGDEWMTIAARDSEGPLLPGEIYDPATIVIRVKGSDLAAYHADKSKKDEIRKRVEVRVF